MDRISASRPIERLAALVSSGGSVSARGSVGSSTAIVAAALVVRTHRPALLVCAHLDESEQIAAEISELGISVVVFPALEALGAEGGAALELVADRNAAALRLRSSEPPRIVVAPIAALMQPMPGDEAAASLIREVVRGERCDRQALISWMAQAGYERTVAVESPAEFAVRGGILDIFSGGSSVAVRIDFDGDQVERIHEIDLATQASDREIDRFIIVGADEERLLNGEGAVDPVTLMDRNAFAIIAELAEVTEQARGYWERMSDAKGVRPSTEVFRSMAKHMHAIVDIGAYSIPGAPDRSVDLPVLTVPPFPEAALDAASALLKESATQDVVLASSSPGEAQRASELLAQSRAKMTSPTAHPMTAIIEEERPLRGGFGWDDGGRPLLVVTAHELLHRFGRIERRRRRASETGTPAIRGGRAREAFLHFEKGDIVVHRDQGIGRYLGLRELDERQAGSAGGAGEREFLTIEYAKQAILYVPASKANLVQRYVGAHSARPQLATMGSKGWTSQKEKVSEAVRDLAAELLRVQAVRESSSGFAFPTDTPWQHRFEAEFPYEETVDQVQAIAATKRDMERIRSMDRLVCGDVGFGKTEIAIRAAFKCCEAGKQVAVLVPTTVLAEQHARTFKERFRAYPFRVESISRFKSDAQVREVLEAAREGKVDVLIGTHRLLSKDVRFRDLGLVVIDEEQRFGVEHKQRLLELRVTADVLTLSATPIPRTLHMSMVGLRDISNLTTPPMDRRAIVTEVIPWNEDRIKQAIARELAREGQVFYLHNRVFDIEEVAHKVRRMAPTARIVIGHGQMANGELERVMSQFIRREADILISTTIIESGLDIPTANTMIIDDAHMFGLADLHQLRGRVGRSRHRAYCYLLMSSTKPLSPDALRRLRAIEDYSMLGAGFRIAVRDLELRGAGNLLGAEQSGHIAAVGYEMYCQLLEGAVHDLRHEKVVSVVDTVIDIGIQGTIPAGYIPSDRRRIEAWRRIGESRELAQLDAIFADLASAYGDPPESVRTLHRFASVRLLATQSGVTMMVRRGGDLILRTNDPAAVSELLKSKMGTVRCVPATGGGYGNDVYWRPPAALLEPKVLLELLERAYRTAPQRKSR
ncbi:MAG: transcription-repair coupling factor [Planctomycetota bacterium]|nr:transcription-repair coupling factor [Planctomycetota bacterium]